MNWRGSIYVCIAGAMQYYNVHQTMDTGLLSIIGRLSLSHTLLLQSVGGKQFVRCR